MDPTTDADAPMFSGYVAAMHGKGWMQRWQGWGRLIAGLKARM
jgi:hypothetical protein